MYFLNKLITLWTAILSFLTGSNALPDLLDSKVMNKVAETYLTSFDDYFTDRKSFDESFGSFISDDVVFVENNEVKASGKKAFKDYYEIGWKPAFAGYDLTEIQRSRPFSTNTLTMTIVAIAELHIDCMTGLSNQVHLLDFDNKGKISKMTHYYTLHDKTLNCLGKLQEMANAASKEKEL